MLLLSPCLCLLGLSIVFAAETKIAPGLVVEEFPRHTVQESTDKLYLALEEFGDPIGKPYRIESLQGWKHGTDRNAIASGWLKISKSGLYEFRTDSYYDRSELIIDGDIICPFRDGSETVQKANLEKGLRNIECIGFVASRGETIGVTVEWRPPGQREFGPIPTKLLFHQPKKGLRESPYEKMPEPRDEREINSFHAPSVQLDRSHSIARELTVVAKDFVIEIYHNGRRLHKDERRLILDRFGATAEKVTVDVKPGDWLVFHVAVNRLRHGGSRYFGVTGHLDANRIGFTSQVSEAWSSCDYPSLAPNFIQFREAGTESRVVKIEKKWHEGKEYMEEFSDTPWQGDAIWGTAASTWLKFCVPKKAPSPLMIGREIPPRDGRVMIIPEKTHSTTSEQQREEPDQNSSILQETTDPEEAKTESTKTKNDPLAILEPNRWPVQIISAIYGTGGKNADVTERVRRLVEVERTFFASNPKHLGADPNPYWNKGLRLVYLKDGVRRVQHRNENEHILPESFYGPQDTAELTEWIQGTRWLGPNGEVQFHQNGRLAGPGIGEDGDWKGLSSNRIEILWPGNQEKTEYRFNHTWSGFRVPEKGKDEYRILR
ncbi:MAG: hypothetical protein AAGA96_16650 [Verrucomicrobiota bacterium]